MKIFGETSGSKEAAISIAGSNEGEGSRNWDDIGGEPGATRSAVFLKGVFVKGVL